MSNHIGTHHLPRLELQPWVLHRLDTSLYYYFHLTMIHSKSPGSKTTQKIQVFKKWGHTHVISKQTCFQTRSDSLAPPILASNFWFPAKKNERFRFFTN